MRWLHRKLHTFQAKSEGKCGYCVMVKGVFEIQSSSKQKLFPELLSMLMSPNVFSEEAEHFKKLFKNFSGHSGL